MSRMTAVSVGRGKIPSHHDTWGSIDPRKKRVGARRAAPRRFYHVSGPVEYGRSGFGNAGSKGPTYVVPSIQWYKFSKQNAG